MTDTLRLHGHKQILVVDNDNDRAQQIATVFSFVGEHFILCTQEEVSSYLSQRERILSIVLCGEIPPSIDKLVKENPSLPFLLHDVIDAALDNNVEKVIALSTDKAANPINLYGATKLASDKIFIAANNIAGGHKTSFAVVRYGNVVGSRGSVVPFFEKLIEEGSDHLPITHEEMTRFWITLQQGVDFVLKNFYRMSGGEIFVPKIPSIKITDLATAMAPKLVQKVVGIRPGEKLHEVMCPGELCYNTFEFDDHFVISPAIRFFSRENDFSSNALNEVGKPVPEGYEYDSLSNPDFLTVDEIAQFNQQACL